MCKKYPDKNTAVKVLEQSEKLNPGQWKQHPEFVALACKNIAKHCTDMDSDKAYVLGLLHDIGRRVGVVSERHMIAGYQYCMEQGWDEVAKICVTHSFIIQDIHSAIGRWDVTKEEYELTKNIINSAIYDDYDLLVQLSDALALSTGFCLLEKRFVDVACRYGVNEHTVARWKKTIEIKGYFEEKIKCSIYNVLPNVKENTFA
ncbi:HD domain-containing protein [Clostridium botulinum]|uniref:HD domain-containing protein n=1 Tax=Clostridium botulinum TaxID=1491 RepID=UPI00016BBFAA|nr:HD domain-containing protein [Clostridium botulinum]APC82919.1 HDOD domain protein [Clostridium botulinum]AXG95726.1 HDOD domain-containing protein [Clostridium botulinum]EDT83067.1 HD domain protein [Clostridium botulinum NCTC 2916]MBY6770853.1 HDOD domain-containing protein [Clostridium botulinum]MBY6774322.1 HDOD domain-containing protein [Clostridium botulinum]